MSETRVRPLTLNAEQRDRDDYCEEDAGDNVQGRFGASQALGDIQGRFT